MFKYLLSLLIILPQVSWGVEIRGYAALELQGFRQGAQYSGQHHTLNAAILLEPEVLKESENGKHLFTIKPFLHLDAEDLQKTHIDMRELSWLYQGNDWEFQAGLSKVYWGVVESRHLVDIINQTDILEGIDGEEKLGQPLIQIATLQDWGNLRLFMMPYFREQSSAGIKSRLRGQKLIDTDQAQFESSLDERAPDFALRYTHYFGDWDVGVAHFYGTSREPLLQNGVSNAGTAVLIPYYQRINQTSVDLQLTKDAWLWKLEALSREGQGERFSALSGGVEYTLYQLLESDADLGLLAEYHRDDRGLNAPATFFDNDTFIGARLALNDVDDSQILAGMLIDNNTSEHSFSMEASKRLSDKWKVELEASIFAGSFTSSAAFAQKDDFVLLRLSRYF